MTLDGIPHIHVERTLVTTNPEVFVYTVIVNTNDSTWRASFGSTEAVRGFIEGVKAGCALIGDVFPDVDELPAELR
jgi:hypothetical protein